MKNIRITVEHGNGYGNADRFEASVAVADEAWGRDQFEALRRDFRNIEDTLRKNTFDHDEARRIAEQGRAA